MVFLINIAPIFSFLYAHNIDFLFNTYKYNSFRLNILGTSGRVCNRTSAGIDGCRLLCCGRGYQTRVREVEEKCRCNFVWCCQVKCDICRYKKEEHVCN